MRTVLVFTPLANPTYIPLGITTLTEFIRANLPDCHIRPLDLNLELWHALAQQSSPGRAFRDFMQGRSGNFFDRHQYEQHLQTWSELAQVHEQYARQAKIYLEQGILADLIEAVLAVSAQKIMEDSPQLVGFSVMYPRQVVFSLALAKYLAARTPARPLLMMGGATISALREEEILTACPFIDGVFSGEGEIGLKMLCEGRPFEQIAGLAWRNQGRIVRNSKPETIALSKVPNPRFDGVSLERYLTPRPVVPVIYSRGCKWRKCRFCAHNFSYSGYRKRSDTVFVDYLAEMQRKRGVQDFYFADQYVDAEDMRRLSEEILRRRLHINFQIMGRPTENYTPELLKTLSQAGCRWISWGVESGSQRLLDLCGKGTQAATIRKVLKAAHAAGISNLLMMIFGLPTSRDEDLNATLDFLDEAAPYVDDVTCSSFQLWDKTAFAAQPAVYGLKITERERFATCPEGAIHSLRMDFREKATDGTYRPGRGPLESVQWQRRKKRSGWHTIYDGLCCEHYLLYAVYQRSCMAAANDFADAT